MRKAKVEETPGRSRAGSPGRRGAGIRLAPALLLLALAGSARAAPYRFVTLDYPPYEFQEEGKVKGPAAEVVREVFRMMGKEVAIEVYPWARSIEMFRDGEVDGIFSFFKTPEREAYTRYSRQVLITQAITLWVPRASRLESAAPLSRLSGLTVGVVHMISYGSAFDEAVRRGILRTEVSYTPESCINNLLAGRFDAWVSNHLGAVYSLRKAGKLEAVRELAPPLQETPAYVGFSRARDLGRLRDEFDRNLALLKESGRYQKIIDSAMEAIKEPPGP